MADFAPKLKKLLRTAGCQYERQGRADHEIWFSPLTNRRFPVDHKILLRDTANANLEQAGLRRRFDASGRAALLARPLLTGQCMTASD